MSHVTEGRGQNRPGAPVRAIEFSPGIELEPVTQAFVDGLDGATPIYKLTPTAARDLLSGLQASTPVTLPDVSIDDRFVEVGPTGSTSIRIVRPAGATGTLPAILYMHGGGWVIGDKDTHDRLVREIAVGANAAVVFVDYDRSPEARFPVAIEQGYAVLQHVAENAAMYEIDATRLALVGDSVGGNMATVIALMAKDRQGPGILAQVLFYPVTDASMSTGSYNLFAEGPWLTRKAMGWFWDQYLPDEGARDQAYVSPLNASLGELRGLPQTLLVVGENDVLRDEGEAYGRRLAEAGVRVTSLRYNGTIHDFVMLNPLATTPAVRGAVGQALGYLRSVFSARNAAKLNG